MLQYISTTPTFLHRALISSLGIVESNIAIYVNDLLFLLVSVLYDLFLHCYTSLLGMSKE